MSTNFKLGSKMRPSRPEKVAVTRLKILRHVLTTP